MRTIDFKYIILSAVLFLSAACNGFLDVELDDEIITSEAIVNKETAEAAAIGLYDSFQSFTLYGGDFVLMADLLGGICRDRIAVYANINRRTSPRTPEGFAASAGVVTAAGYTIFKLAPFDEVSVERCAGGDIAALMAPGLARIRATRAGLELGVVINNVDVRKKAADAFPELEIYSSRYRNDSRYHYHSS